MAFVSAKEWHGGKVGTERGTLIIQLTYRSLLFQKIINRGSDVVRGLGGSIALGAKL